MMRRDSSTRQSRVDHTCIGDGTQVKTKELGGDPLIPIHVAVVAASGHCEAARL
jgi:hypothetical protein